MSSDSTNTASFDGRKFASKKPKEQNKKNAPSREERLGQALRENLRRRKSRGGVVESEKPLAEGDRAKKDLDEL